MHHHLLRVLPVLGVAAVAGAAEDGTAGWPTPEPWRPPSAPGGHPGGFPGGGPQRPGGGFPASGTGGGGGPCVTPSGKSLSPLSRSSDYVAVARNGQRYTFNFCRAVQPFCTGSMAEEVSLCRSKESLNLVCGLLAHTRAEDGADGTVSLGYDARGTGPVSPECGSVTVEVRCGDDEVPPDWHVEQRSVNVFLPSVMKTTIWGRATIGCRDYTPASGIGAGWWFVILVVVGAAAYVGGGVYYKNKQMGATGIESIPNIDFWREVPSLAADGAVFFSEWCRERWAKFRGDDGYQPIDDDGQ